MRPLRIRHLKPAKRLFTYTIRPYRGAIMSSSAELTPDVLQTLYKYGACDISDALLKLKVPGAGFLPDLNPYCSPPAIPGASPRQIFVAPASTVLFVPKNDTELLYPTGNIPTGMHWVDLTVPGTIVVESQPEGQKNAVLGGIMAVRMKKLNTVGVVVSGRIRDVEELKETGLIVGYTTLAINHSTAILPAPPFKHLHSLSFLQYSLSASWSHKYIPGPYYVPSAFLSFFSTSLYKLNPSKTSPVRETDREAFPIVRVLETERPTGLEPLFLRN
jgi:Aldolase/RraA